MLRETPKISGPEADNTCRFQAAYPSAMFCAWSSTQYSQWETGQQYVHSPIPQALLKSEELHLYAFGIHYSELVLEGSPFHSFL